MALEPYLTRGINIIYFYIKYLHNYTQYKIGQTSICTINIGCFHIQDLQNNFFEKISNDIRIELFKKISQTIDKENTFNINNIE